MKETPNGFVLIGSEELLDLIFWTLLDYCKFHGPSEAREQAIEILKEWAEDHPD